MATAKARKKAGRQKGLVSVTDKSSNDDSNDVAGLGGRTVFTSVSEAEVLPSTSRASSQIARAIAELPQARDTISAQSKKLEMIVQLKTSIKNQTITYCFTERSKRGWEVTS